MNDTRLNLDLITRQSDQTFDVITPCNGMAENHHITAFGFAGQNTAVTILHKSANITGINIQTNRRNFHTGTGRIGITIGHFMTNTKSPISSVSFIEPDGIQNGWKNRDRNTPAINRAMTTVLMSSQIPPPELAVLSAMMKSYLKSLGAI